MQSASYSVSDERMREKEAAGSSDSSDGCRQSPLMKEQREATRDSS